MNMGQPEGESMRMGFEGGIKLEFHGAKVTSDGGLLALFNLSYTTSFQIGVILLGKMIQIECLLPLRQSTILPSGVLGYGDSLQW